MIQTLLQRCDSVMIKLKGNHKHFYQVQGQMALYTGVISVISTFKNHMVERIPEFWDTAQTLTKFYFSCIYPTSGT